MKKQDEEEFGHQRSSRRLRTSHMPKVSRFASQKLDEQDSIILNNRESNASKQSRVSFVPSGGPHTKHPLAVDEHAEHTSNFDQSPLISRQYTNTQNEISNTSQRDTRKSAKKLSMHANQTDFLKRALGESSDKETDEEFHLNQHGTVNKVLEQGDAFGEKALTNPGAKRTASIYTVTDCEFIIIHKKDFATIFNRFNKYNQLKLEFLLNTVPNLDKVNSRLILEDYMYSLHVSDSSKGHKLTVQGKGGEKVFFISSGYCVVKKEVKIPSAKSEDTLMIKKKTTVQISRIGPNTIIGDELLFGSRKEKKKYNYTTIVTCFLYLIALNKIT